MVDQPTKGVLRVEALRSLSDVAPLRERIDALNLASRRPCPFSTYEYIQTFLAHDEYARPDKKLLFLAAFDGDQLVGYLPLCRSRDRIFRLPYHRLDVLVWHDTDRPHAVARAEDEARVCEALYRHLLKRERWWSYLELGMQDADSGLAKLPPLNPLRYYARTFENMPNTTVPLSFASLADYFKTLAGPQRRNVSRLCRRLLAAGRAEVIACTDPLARDALLDLYLDLERRSWKEAAHAGIRRDPRRVELFRALCATGQPLELGFDLVLLDDLPIAGLVSGAFAGGLYGLEMAFDEAYDDLAPGHMLSIMAIRRGIEGRYRSFNFDGNYAYYKSRLGGVVTETKAIQIYRVGRLPWLKARGGELRRRLRPPPPEADKFNPERRRAQTDGGEGGTAKSQPSARPERRQEREQARDALRELEAAGLRIDRLVGDKLERALPFSRKEAA